MRPVRLLCLSGLLVVSNGLTQTVNHAVQVVGYDPGQVSGTLTNALAVLGAPSRETADPQWGTFPVDPFSPPYLASQMVALGDGGSLIVRMERPVPDDPANPHGLDFLVFGNAFFQLNGDSVTTSGLLGGTNFGQTILSVSHDGIIYYQLDPEMTPPPDGWFPSDHAGAPNIPVNPALTAADFAGLDLDRIRQLYGGSAGGTGYDIAWARDPEGNPVSLPFIDYIRFDQVNGEAQFDAVSAVPSTPSIFADYAADPATENWHVFGQSSLFHWEQETQNLHITWDSSKTNSYFYKPLGRTLNREDDFALGFDLHLETVLIGVDPIKPFTFQIAIGLVDLASATNPDLWRASGVNAIHGPRNIIEFAYFPDSGFGATISPSIISSNNQFASRFNYPIELTTDTTFNVLLRYTAIDKTLRTTLNRNHVAYADIDDVVLTTDFTDFLVDTIAVCSYSDAGQDPMFGGSVLARGTVDNLFAQLPPPPLNALSGSMTHEGYHVTFHGKAGWTYTLERSPDLLSWTTSDTHGSIQSGPVMLEDLSPPPQQAFYRVGASR